MAQVSVDEDRPAIDSVKARIRERGARIQEQEQERALRRLRARDDLTEQEVAAVRELARSLTDQLLSVPEEHLDAVAAEKADSQQAAVTLELFGEE